MKRLTICILLFAGCYLTGGSQTPLFSIFDAFEREPLPGEGKVIVHQSDSLRQLVGTKIDSENIDVVNGKAYLKTTGYMVQAYSGNNQRKSKDEAFALQTKIKNLYSDTETYVKFDSPFWKLYVGNYRSFEEASQMLRALRLQFPQIKNEIYVVEGEIRLALD